jgi:uncharacterized membrane protein HdeD (DUF308 family)
VRAARAWGSGCGILGILGVIVGVAFALERGEVGRGLLDMTLGVVLIAYGLTQICAEEVS